MSELAYTVTRRPGESVIDIASPLGVIATMHVVYARALAAELAPVLDDHNGDTGTLECDECGWIIEAPKENTHV